MNAYPAKVIAEIFFERFTYEKLMAEREGFEPSVPVTVHTISSRAPSANSAISPNYHILNIKFIYNRFIVTFQNKNQINNEKNQYTF